MPHKHVSRVAEGIQSISDVLELNPNTLTLCLHNNLLRNLGSVSQYTRLVDLNVSLNRLVSINGLQALQNLTSLNLSANLLEDCNSVAGLSRLRALQLQFNRIRDLSALCKLQSVDLSLEYLDLRGNQFNSVLEARAISRLSSIPNLRLGPAEVLSKCHSGSPEHISSNVLSAELASPAPLM